MADGISFDVDTSAVVAALTKLGVAAQPYINAASSVSASAIATEARGRLARRLGAQATGRSVSSIVARPARDGNGFVVVADREPYPSLPLWLEKGTKRGRGTHANIPRPYFYASALLEEGAHLRRIEAAIQQALDDQGMGD